MHAAFFTSAASYFRFILTETFVFGAIHSHNQLVSFFRRNGMRLDRIFWEEAFDSDGEFHFSPTVEGDPLILRSEEDASATNPWLDLGGEA
jgi:hypothetical protein